MSAAAVPTPAAAPIGRRDPWPIVAAVAYVTLVAVGLFAVPAAPGVSASGARLVRFYRDHASGVRTTTWLGAVSLIPLAVLMAHLRQRLDGVARDVALLGAVGLVATTIVWSWFGAGLALHAALVPPGTARALADVSAYFGPVLTVSIILLVVPVGLEAWRREDALPRWLAWLSFAFAVEQAVETITIFGTRGFTAPGGTMNFELGATLFLVWVVGAGIAVSHPVGDVAASGS